MEVVKMMSALDHASSILIPYTEDPKLKEVRDILRSVSIALGEYKFAEKE